ncbi:hypothetical protein [Rubellicoccus peritrichatus]|uniref:Uncharacterized protein n=1 Tax=Rubellicoccus peritrichatus TaxID=3080537 RepID=A0AAQ3LCE4_9BACT|nr:hypothetical protein [Puniceicoccus sp. CR14]WOO43100.1 hypothetical protein RZN69_08340 [Puniceicoccus sp. CR14]
MRDPIEEALRQVKDIQNRMLDKQRFKGYSGRARALGGCFALMAAMLVSLTSQPIDSMRVLYAWGAVFAFAASINFGALVYWFLSDPEVERDWRRVRPLVAVLPSLVVGFILTVTLVERGAFELLYGVWMLIYGLANFASRAVLPDGIRWAGWYYVLAGSYFLIFPTTAFTAPLAAGAVFFIGEWVAGLILHYDEHPENTVWAFLGLPNLLNSDEQKER